MLRVCAFGLFVRVWDLAVYSERMSLCEEKGGWCFCPGTPLTVLVGVCAA